MLKSAVSNQTTSVEDPGSRIGAYPDVEGGLGGGQVSVAPPTQAGERPLTRMSRVTRQEWAPSILVFVLDILTWAALYGIASYLRDHDTAFSGSFQFAVIEIIQIAVIVQAVFIIGGYSPRTETRGLAYTAEHILALLCALGISAFVIYVAATYDHSMKPSRFAILSSFLVFIPASLFYRRALRTHATAAAAGRAFLVLGCGKMAAEFYCVYRASPNQQGLQSIDPFWPMQAGFQLSRASPYHYVKRMCDIMLSGLLLVLCAPLMAALACLIWLTSGRPVIFRQHRVGRDEAVFTAYKFRTMRSE